ncbi:cysteine desulfurase [Aliiroseovarius halocynthiae]|uniref:Cysteine desulfurase n=1 Tax=Aliiroseovarius halocynthiae TaxID=985055 RepID=A0A545SVW6_9RHOB|nr:aminotransferase class V-fold PLP-dependent enzyme [Aliiroseovarius halocynthiae]TQV69102.1 aminotransferase class V-fold PLP-dependent enzyme [Aliiroseovarius halocynthiae]SMR71859.1 cysteine desulfurase [Aliiroseovarius halocynthiae]
MSRAYLDWNATTPLRAEAKVAMIDAMELVGNPSSVHAEGRAAKGLIERARKDLAAALGADGADIIFTSSATEAAALALAGRNLSCAGIEHDAVRSWCTEGLAIDRQGAVNVPTPAQSTLQLANSETGIIQALPERLFMTDATQAFGKIPFAFNWCGADMAIVSAHKLGGPKGIGALIVKRGTEIEARIKGGGQEMGRRSGTENVIGVAGFAAAALAAQRDLETGVWSRVEKLRKILENTIAESANKTIFVGKDANRLPNTSCFVTPGWKGETQVMVMDLAGFAVSAGSACSSGKVKTSAALAAMGFDRDHAGCALRVSLGPLTSEDEVRAFAQAWLREHDKFRARGR